MVRRSGVFFLYIYGFKDDVGRHFHAEEVRKQAAVEAKKSQGSIRSASTAGAGRMLGYAFGVHGSWLALLRRVFQFVMESVERSQGAVQNTACPTSVTAFLMNELVGVLSGFSF